MLRLSRYVVASPSFVAAGEPSDQRVVFSTRTLRTFVLSAESWERIAAGDLEGRPEKMIAALSEAAILVPDDEDELAVILKRNRAAVAGGTTLYECIQPTGFCNFACDYCGQDHTPAKLSSPDQDLVIERIAAKLASGRYDRVRIAWFGGEPLAAMQIIRSLSPRLQSTAAAYGCSFGAHLVTNGLLLDVATARELVEKAGVDEIEVTLDGIAEAHDRRRHTATGRPTFDRIYANLRAVAAAGLPVQLVLRCNVDRRNCDGIPQLIDQVAQLEGREHIRLYFAPIHDWGNAASELGLSADEYAGMELQWMALMVERGLEPDLLPAAKPVVCMAVSPNAELIDPYGQIFNCSEVSLVPTYGRPNVYARGTLKHAAESAAATSLSGFFDDVQDGKVGCTFCPMLPVCGGACPKQWRDGNVPCPSAKRNLPDRLLLAYARSGGP
jgi:uncharacterized protein